MVFEGSPQLQSPANSTSADHATFGDVTSTGNKCVIGNPNTGDVTRDQIDWVWENTMKKYVPTAAFQNLIFDQLVNNKGKLNYCAMIESQINLWNRWLVGYECWPVEKVEVTVVGFAVKDKSIMDWTDDSLGTIYEGILDNEGSPKCPDECYKHQGWAANADTSACKGTPFDMSLWPSTSPGEGAIGTGGDWGQRVEVNELLNTIDLEQQRVMLHEIGHGFGLPMYVDENKPAGYPACVMNDSDKLTDGDGWLLRSVLENIKSRLNY